MTVSTIASNVVYQGNGVTSTFPFPFKVFESDHLVVERRVAATGVVDRTYAADEFTVVGLGTDAGSVTLDDGALAATYELIISRVVPYEQDMDIVHGGGFLPEVVEEQLDLLEMQIQQIADMANRSIRLAKGQDVDELVAGAGLAGKFLAFDANGDPTVSTGTGADSGLRTDLAAAAGADLVGLSGGGSLQDGILWMTPQMKGAIGNDVADDTVALQSLANASKNIDLGGVGYTYKITDAITLQPGTHIRGRGATIRQTVDLTNIFDVEGVEGVTIDSIIFEDTGAGHVASDANPHAAVFGGVGTDNIKVFNCRFTGITFAAIRLRGSTGIDISHNDFVGPGVGTLPYLSDLRCYPIAIDADCIGFRICHNDISEALHGIRIERASRGVCIGNDIHDIPAQHGFYIGADCHKIAIIGNTLHNIALQAIKIQSQNTFDDIRDITVVGNDIVTCDQGITLSNAAGGTAQAAKLRNIVVCSNTISDCVATAINIQNTIGARVNSNTIENAGTGISYSACQHLRISHNSGLNIDKSGIRDQSASTYVYITDNDLHSVALLDTLDDNFGLFIQDVNHHTIKNNQVTSSNGVAGSRGMKYGARLGGTQTTCIFEGNDLRDADEYGLSVASSAEAFLKFKNNLLSGELGAAISNPALPSVASAAALVLPTQHDVILVTGTTSITSISAAGHTGHRVTLVFDGVLTVTRGSNLYAASNFVTSDKDTITLVCDGVNWLETCRSAN